MLYSALTSTQQAHVALADKYYRSLTAALTKVAAQANMLVNEAFIASNVDPVIASLDAGQTIPNSTNYAGAQSLVVADFVTLQTTLRALSTELQAQVGLVVKAVGVNAH